MLALFNVRIVRKKQFENLEYLINKYKKEINLIVFCEKNEDRNILLELLPFSNSQTGQDLFAIWTSKFKNNGYYVEIGATDGKGISNTFLLSQKYSWKGILCEPAKSWSENLKLNRPESIIETKCCWSGSGEILNFLESDNRELSTIRTFSKNDKFRNIRSKGITYEVETISLVDMLTFHDAPEVIDFISIDTEGSEYEILRNFPFDCYKFRFICVEHNHGKQMKQLETLLCSVGYLKVYPEISGIDHWFINHAVNSEFKAKYDKPDIS